MYQQVRLCANLLWSDLDTYARAHCKDSTTVRYEEAFRLYLLPAFRPKDIAEITREEVKTLIYGLLAQGKSRSRVANIRAPIREMFNHAIEDGHVTANPCTNILRGARKEEQQPADFLTREELGHLLRTCQEHFPAAYPFISCLTRTGLRIGEAIALHWDDIDWHGRFIHVRATLSRYGLTTPKSGKSRRVDMSQQLADTLKTLLVERKKDTLRKGWGEVPPWVFVNEVGKPLDKGAFHTRVWRKLLAKAALRRIRVHDLRHTFASLLIQQGAPLTYVKEQLGRRQGAIGPFQYQNDRGHLRAPHPRRA
jgi:integrase